MSEYKNSNKKKSSIINQISNFKQRTQEGPRLTIYEEHPNDSYYKPPSRTQQLRQTESRNSHHPTGHMTMKADRLFETPIPENIDEYSDSDIPNPHLNGLKPGCVMRHSCIANNLIFLAQSENGQYIMVDNQKKEILWCFQKDLRLVND